MKFSTTDVKPGIQNFKAISNTVLGKLQSLKEQHIISTGSMRRLKLRSAAALFILDEQKQRVTQVQNRRKSWQLTGLAFKILGSTIALVYLCLLDLPVPTLVSAMSVIGVLIKLENWYCRRKTNKSVAARLKEFFSSEDWKTLKESESFLESRITLIIKILTELYSNSSNAKDTDFDIGEKDEIKTTETNAKMLRTPRLISVMKAAKKVAGLHDKFRSVLDYSSDFGVESMEIVEQTYDVASGSLGETIPAGMIQGAIRLITIVVSSYEVHRLLGSNGIENETTIKKIQEHIGSQKEKIRAYQAVMTSIEVFLRLRG